VFGVLSEYGRYSAVSKPITNTRPRGEMPKCNKVRRPPLNADRPVSSVKIRTWIRGLGFGDLGLSPSL
jgi:hypothetical protein